MSQLKLKFTWMSHWLGLHGRLGLWLFSLLLLTKFSLVEAIMTTLVVVGHTFIGLQAIARSRAASDFSGLARTGLGFCLGAILATIAYVVAVSLSDVRLAIVIQVVLFGVALMAKYSRSNNGKTQVSVEDMASVKWLAVLTLIGLSPDWFWCLPLAVCLIAVNIAVEKVSKRPNLFRASVLVVVASLSIATWIRIVDRRPIRAWFADDRFAEVFSFGLGKWGLSHNPMLLGESISYHWFSFAWVGALSRLTNSSIGVTLFHFAPVVVGLCCAIFGYSIARRFSSSTKIALFAIAMAFFVDTERFFRGYGFHAFHLSSFSQFFSLAIGLAILLTVITLGGQVFMKMPLITAVFLVGLIGSKISSGLVISIALLAIWAYKIVQDQKLNSNLGSLIVAVVIPVALSFLSFFGDPRGGSPSVIRRPGWPAGISRDLWDVYNGSFVRYFPILVFLSLALGGFALLPLFLVKESFVNGNVSSQVFIFFSSGLIASFAQMWIAQGSGASELVGDSDNTLYSLQFLVSLSFVLIFSAMMPLVFRVLAIPLLRAVMVVSLLFGLSIAALSINLKVELSSSYLVPLLTSAKPASPFLLSCLLALCVWAVMSRFRMSVGGFQPRTVALLVLVTIQGAACFYLASANFSAVSGRQQAEWRLNDTTLVPSQATQRAASWLKSNSKSAEIIATTMTSSSPSLATLTSRRELVGFPITIRLLGLNSDFDARDRSAVSEFGSVGSCDGAQYLQGRGVGYYWVETLNPNTPDIDRCAKEVFRDETIVIYSLR